jgi:hypothetical protein
MHHINSLRMGWLQEIRTGSDVGLTAALARDVSTGSIFCCLLSDGE